MLKRLTVRVAYHIAHSGLPLLAKELTEQAARRRTFVIRVVYATILFLMSSLFFYQTLEIASGGSPLAVLGRGKEMFGWLVGIQFAGIYFFMPAMTSGVITQEKERASLQLLFLTRLGPWTILFEKLLGRLVPMGCFLLLSLPLLGFAYTLGGVSRDMLWKGAWMLLLATIQMGTLSLACSTFFRTTVASFMASYVLAFLMFFGPYVCVMLVMLVGWMLDIQFDRIFSQTFSNVSETVVFQVLFPLFTPPHFFMNMYGGGALGTWSIVLHSIVVLGTSGGFLLLARRFIFERAFLPAARPFWMAFRRRPKTPPSAQRTSARQPSTADAAEPIWLDEPTEVVRETAGSLPEGPVGDWLPGDEPVAWRETAKRFLGDVRHLWLATLVITVPLVLLCIILGLTNEIMFRSLITGPLIFLMWLLAVLTVSVKSSSLIAGERTHQTLDVLCTSPLTGREIVLQKFRGVRRLIIALWAPFLVVILFVPWWLAREARHYAFYSEHFSVAWYVLCAVLSIAIYFPLVAWLSLLIGLRVKSQIRAIIGSMAAIAIWCIAPLVFLVLPASIMAQSTIYNEDWKLTAQMVSLLSPATIVFVNEASGLHDYPGPWLTICLNFGLYGTALVVIRAICLKNSDRWLGRTTEPSAGQDSANARRWLPNRLLAVVRRLTEPRSDSS